MLERSRVLHFFGYVCVTQNGYLSIAKFFKWNAVGWVSNYCSGGLFGWVTYLDLHWWVGGLVVYEINKTNFCKHS